MYCTALERQVAIHIGGKGLRSNAEEDETYKMRAVVHLSLPAISLLHCYRLFDVPSKIFARIEWKDTSKNSTGSKNNSLSE